MLHGARHLLARGAVAAAHAALVEAARRADDAVAAGLDALALHAHRGGVRAAGSAVGHLGAAEECGWLADGDWVTQPRRGEELFLGRTDLMN